VQFGAELLAGTSPDDTFTARDIALGRNFKLAASPASQGDNVPVWKNTVNFGRVWHTMGAGDLLDSTTPKALQFFSTEYRPSILGDFTVAAIHPGSQPISFDTMIADNLSAFFQAFYWLQLLSVRRDSPQISIDMTRAGAIELGNLRGININRLGYDGGKTFVVRGITHVFAKRNLLLDCWG
jgi:hypothetical protein